MQTTVAIVFHSDVDLSQSLDWPNLDGTVTTWPPRPAPLFEAIGFVNLDKL